MNLVAKIVKAFGGKIEVDSERGVGTCFSVTLALEHSRLESDQEVPSEQYISGSSVAIIESAAGSKTPSTQSCHGLLLSNARKTLGDAGARVLESDWNGNTDADVYFVLESDAREELSRLQNEKWNSMPMPPEALNNTPFVILCDNALSARDLRTSGLGLLGEHVELISQPAGPDRVVKAILSCLQSKQQVKRATDLAAAVKDIPVVVPHPDRNARLQSLTMRPLGHTNAGAPAESMLTNHRHSKKQSPPRRERMPHVTFQRSLSSEERLPTLPNLTRPEVSVALQKKSDKTGSGISLLLVDDNVRIKRPCGFRINH